MCTNVHLCTYIETLVCTHTHSAHTGVPTEGSPRGGPWDPPLGGPPGGPRGAPGGAPDPIDHFLSGFFVLIPLILRDPTGRVFSGVHHGISPYKMVIFAPGYHLCATDPVF